MATIPIPTKVNPGDLIRAMDWDLMVDKLTDLETRLAALEGTGIGSGAVALSAFVPAPPFRVLQDLEIQGRNFGYTLGAQRLFFGSVRVDRFKFGSSDTKLLISIPALPASDLPAIGGPVTITVTNGQTTATQTVQINPAIAGLSGNVDATYKDVSPNPIMTAQGAFFHYTIRSRANRSAHFVIQPSSNQIDVTNFAVLDAERRPLGSGLLPLDAGAQQDVYIQIKSLPVLTSPLSLSLSVVDNEGGSVSTGDSHQFTVGVITPPPDTSFDVSPNTLEIFNVQSGTADPSGGSYDAGTKTMTIKPGFRGRMTIDASFYQAASFSVTPGAAPAGWTTGLVNTPLVYQIAQSELVGVPPTATKAPQLGVVPGNNAAAGTLDFTMTRDGAPAGKTIRFNLKVG